MYAEREIIFCAGIFVIKVSAYGFQLRSFIPFNLKEKIPRLIGTTFEKVAGEVVKSLTRVQQFKLLYPFNSKLGLQTRLVITGGVGLLSGVWLSVFSLSFLQAIKALAIKTDVKMHFIVVLYNLPVTIKYTNKNSSFVR